MGAEEAMIYFFHPYLVCLCKNTIQLLFFIPLRSDWIFAAISQRSRDHFYWPLH
jgi:hypothetical protein